MKNTDISPVVAIKKRVVARILDMISGFFLPTHLIGAYFYYRDGQSLGRKVSKIKVIDERTGTVPSSNMLLKRRFYRTWIFGGGAVFMIFFPIQLMHSLTFLNKSGDEITQLLIYLVAILSFFGAIYYVVSTISAGINNRKKQFFWDKAAGTIVVSSARDGGTLESQEGSRKTLGGVKLLNSKIFQKVMLFAGSVIYIVLCMILWEELSALLIGGTLILLVFYRIFISGFSRSEQIKRGSIIIMVVILLGITLLGGAMLVEYAKEVREERMFARPKAGTEVHEEGTFARPKVGAKVRQVKSVRDQVELNERVKENRYNPQQSLNDLVATVIDNGGDLSDEQIAQYFPEFIGKEQAVADFLVTMEAKPNLTPEEIRLKFPEFFDEID